MAKTMTNRIRTNKYPDGPDGAGLSATSGKSDTRLRKEPAPFPKACPEFCFLTFVAAILSPAFHAAPVLLAQIFGPVVFDTLQRFHARDRASPSPSAPFSQDRRRTVWSAAGTSRCLWLVWQGRL